jgi:hypothetical protein
VAYRQERSRILRVPVTRAASALRAHSSEHHGVQSVLFDLALIVILPTVLVVVVAVLRGRRRTVSSGEFDSDSVSFAGGVISALFTVVLAFYIVFAWQLGADIDGHAEAEAEAVIDAHWQADLLPEPYRTTLQSLLRTYASSVVDEEWPSLVDGEADPRPAELVQELRNEFAAVPAFGGAVDLAREQGLRDVRQIDDNHRSRVDLATGGDTFTDVLLVGTLVGAALMIAFPLLVGVSTRPANVMVMAILTLVVGATVFVVIQLTRPLDGPFGVGPDALLTALQEMRPQP